MSMAESFSYIPQEIILEVILPRLPVKSLLRFTSVCKSWRSTISSPRFEKLHSRLSKKRSNPNSHKIILKHKKILRIVDYEGAKEAVDLRLQLKGRLCSFVGICNGLTCFILSRGEVVIFNPATRRSLTIQEKGLHFKNCYGLGYDSSRNDYKLVTFDHQASCKGIHVYSLRSNYWKRAKECFIFDVAWIQTCGVYAHGYLHWIVDIMPGSEKYCRTIIATFNIAAETLGQLDMPAEVNQRPYIFLSGLQIGFSGEYLYLYHYWANRFEGWVMKENGSAQSWTKFCIKLPWQIGNLECLGVKQVFLLNGDKFIVVLQTRHGVVALNGLEEFTHPGINSKFEILDVVPYVESLVGLNWKQMKRIEDHSPEQHHPFLVA